MAMAARPLEQAALMQQDVSEQQTTGPQPRCSRRLLATSAVSALALLAIVAVAWRGGHRAPSALAKSAGIPGSVVSESEYDEAREYAKKALSIKHEAEGELADAKASARKALKAAESVNDKKLAAAKAKAAEQMKLAQAAVDKAHQATAGHRMCVDLPGTKLKATRPIAVKPIVGKPDAHTPLKCRVLCQQYPHCMQATFEVEGKSCKLFSRATLEPAAFGDGKYNSSYCGETGQMHKMIGMLKSVFKKKPYVPPMRTCSWAGDDCSKSKCCANVPVPNWDFTKFSWYSCFRKDKYFAACQKGTPPGGWDGEVLGGMGTREVPKAPKGVLVQPTTLYCFAVVMWNAGPTQAFYDSEGALANNYKSKGLSIMQCDAHEFLSGTALNYGGDGSSINNIDSFITAWNKIRDMGRYKKYGWTVKVDSDAVFFPERLKWHLNSLRTPAGSRVYLENINFKFRFMGALEVLSREALETYFAKNSICAGKVGHQGGEDYYMKSCLDGIGIDHQTDWDLLNDAYAAQGNCNDDWAVAFHFYKKVSGWNQCHQEAQNAWNAKHR